MLLQTAGVNSLLFNAYNQSLKTDIDLCGLRSEQAFTLKNINSGVIMKNTLFSLLALFSLPAAFLAGSQSQDKSGAANQAKSFRLFNPDTMFKPTAGYSQVGEVTGGKLVYIAGQVALDRSGNLVGRDDFRAQVQQVFENLKSAVEAAGGDTHSIVKLNYFCSENVDPAQIPLVREIRDKYVDVANPPTSTFVIVKRLVRPEWLIEVEAVAAVKQ
jgi:enamine deaminase RidA (YjgF/YER057c/UK114 family)